MTTALAIELQAAVESLARRGVAVRCRPAASVNYCSLVEYTCQYTGQHKTTIQFCTFIAKVYREVVFAFIDKVYRVAFCCYVASRLHDLNFHSYCVRGTQRRGYKQPEDDG